MNIEPLLAALAACSRGFTNLSLQIVAGEDHNPMAATVLAYIDSLRQARASLSR